MRDRILAATQLLNALPPIIQRANLSNEDVLAVAVLYPGWKAGTAYDVGEIVRYEGSLYRVVQAHTSQADWLPPSVPALYSAVTLTPQGYEQWKQPTGAHDAYNIGDKVTHNGSIYESLINGNTTVPGSDPRWWKEI